MIRDEQMEAGRKIDVAERLKDIPDTVTGKMFRRVLFDEHKKTFEAAWKAADATRPYTDEDVRALAEAVKDAHYAKRPEERALALGSAMSIAERILKGET